MSGKQLNRHMVVCDGGCGATVGENGEYASPVESRAAAAERGWIVVPKIKSNGKPASALSDDGRLLRGHDVCPACQPRFRPEVLKANGGGGSYIKRMQEENRRMREELSKRGVHL